MKLIKTLTVSVIVISLIIAVACENNKDENIKDTDTIDTLDILEINDILFNIPIENGTILADKEYNIDFRVEIEGHKIDSTILIIDNNYIVKLDTFIISTNSIGLTEGMHSILLVIRSVNRENGDTVYYKTDRGNLEVLENLGSRYVDESISDGKLQLTWPELDKKNTNSYLIERYMGVNMEYSHKTETQSPVYPDNFYVGEEANFRISVINNDGGIQNIWYYKKSAENIAFNVSQNQSGGYNIHFSKSKYPGSFGQYYLTTGINLDPEFIFSSSDIQDTVYRISDAKFADEARFWLRYLPKEYPGNVSDEDWMLYGKFIYSRYGDKSFQYDRITMINNENVAFTHDGKIFKYNLNLNQKTDSVIKEPTHYGFLTTTPLGKYLYAVDESIYGSPVYFWSANSLASNPVYTFRNNYVIPPVSDNLIVIMTDPDDVTPGKLALYDVTNGNQIYKTVYIGSSERPKISSDGNYFFLYDSYLKLCSYINKTFRLIWEETDRFKHYRFYDFNPQNNEICYIWDDDKKFSIRNTSDFSEINSFSMELEEIINIDYYSGRIMGYTTDRILVYKLDDGTLEKEIPANVSELFFYSNRALLIGNTIYSNHGIKYTLN